VTPATRLKLALSLIGFLTWAYGVRAGHSGLRLTGIGFLAGAFAVRIIDAGRRRGRDEAVDSDSPAG